MRRNLKFRYLWNSPLYPACIRQIISLLLLTLPGKVDISFNSTIKEFSFSSYILHGYCVSLDTLVYYGFAFIRKSLTAEE